MNDTRTELIAQLRTEGVCVAEGVLDEDSINYLRNWSQKSLETLSDAHRAQNRSQGSLINIADVPAFADIIGHKSLQDLFDSLRFANPVFSSGYIISKPAHSPALFWHQDWWGWDDPLSYTPLPAQIFIMIYLTDTTPDNGCLRVISGSHRRPHAMHLAEAAHADDLSRVADPLDALYQSIDGEVAVPVTAGDVVIGDARVLHGAYANNSEHERTLVTLWFHPDFASLPEAMQARIQDLFYRRGVDTDPESEEQLVMTAWPDIQRNKIKHLFPHYEGSAEPHAWNRQPDVSLLPTQSG